MANLSITQPDDFHIHLRDGDSLSRTVVDCASRFKRATIMPNLKTPISNVKMAAEYRQRIMQHLKNSLETSSAASTSNLPQEILNAAAAFHPLMTLYLSDATSAETIDDAGRSEFIHACKLYPAGVTTHSQHGVNDIEALYPIFERMSENKLLLLIHGEVNDPTVDIFDREKVFIDKTLTTLLQRFPNLKIVLEHITTQDAVDFVTDGPDNLAATITAHHLLLNRNDLLSGGIKPHYYCLPILKRRQHQQALLSAAISGNAKFFLGSDSAPHSQSQKESSCGCAGIYTAHAGIELYAEIFDNAGARDKLEKFASHFGAQFYGLPINTSIMTLEKSPWEVPSQLTFGSNIVIPFMAGQTLQWRIHSITG